jgi:signal transduction histidine kinase
MAGDNPAAEKSTDEPKAFALDHIHGDALDAETLSAVLANSLSGIAIAELVRTPEGTPDDVRFIAVNESFETHTGVAASGLVGTLASSIVPDFNRTSLFSMYVDVVESGQQLWTDHYFEPLRRHWHIKAYPLPKKDCFVANVIDISHLEAQQNSLAATRQMFHTAFDAAHHIMFIMSKDGAILDLNRAARRYFNQEGPVPENTTCYQLHDQQEPCPGCPVPKALRRKTAQSRQLQSPLNQRYYECTANPVLDSDGAVTNIVMALHDITAHKEREIFLEKARQEAQNAAEMKSQFLSNCSHELRTPLNAILGFSQLMLEDNLDEKHHDWLQYINRSGNVLLALINNILTFSRIDKESFSMIEQKTELRHLVETLIELAAQTLREKTEDAEIILDWDDTLPQYIFADTFYLKQLFFSVLQNAVKFGENRTIHCKVERFIHTPDRPMLRFSVTDQGPGISDDLLKSIFSPFVQGDGSVRRRYGGLGIGLPVAHAIAQRMGGSIRCDNTSAKGSTFTVEVALQDALSATTLEQFNRV